MKLYALRDRMLAYFLRPFIADSHFQVLASLTETINGEKTGTLQAAPHHFELWQLAEIDEETGNVTGKPEFIQDCASLVRDRIRKNTGPGDPATPGTTSAHESAPGDTQGSTATSRSPMGHPTQTTPLAAHQGLRGPDTGH